MTSRIELSYLDTNGDLIIEVFDDVKDAVTKAYQMTQQGEEIVRSIVTYA